MRGVVPELTARFKTRDTCSDGTENVITGSISIYIAVMEQKTSSLAASVPA
jgi:hypothetical protein